MVQLCMPDRVLHLAMMNFPPCWVGVAGVGGLLPGKFSVTRLPSLCCAICLGSIGFSTTRL